MTPTRLHILVGVLDWGLGHATRMVPVIDYLLTENHYVSIAGNGRSLTYLRQCFPQLDYIEIPAPVIRYSHRKRQILCLLGQIPLIAIAFYKNHRQIEKYVKQHRINLVISDNRPGVRSRSCSSVYITHQIHPGAGTGNPSFFCRLASAVHRNIIVTYNYCFVPDNQGVENLSENLSHNKVPDNVQYIGFLSALARPVLHDVKISSILLLLSGPEPQRSIFEKLLVHVFASYHGQVILVRGANSKGEILYPDNFKVIDVAGRAMLSRYISECNAIVCRSGYSTLMDLAVMGRKALLVPTPGQPEQEYLARVMKEKYQFSVIQQSELNRIDFSCLTNLQEWKIESRHNFKKAFEEVFCKITNTQGL